MADVKRERICGFCGQRYRRHAREGMNECASCARQPADIYWERARSQYAALDADQNSDGSAGVR